MNSSNLTEWPTGRTIHLLIKTNPVGRLSKLIPIVYTTYAKRSMLVKLDLARDNKALLTRQKSIRRESVSIKMKCIQ